MNDPSKSWPVTWEGNRHAQNAATRAASPAQRLAWLEEAIAFAHRAGALGDPASRSMERHAPIDNPSADSTNPGSSKS